MEALGRHIIAELYDCSPDKLNQVVGIEQAMVHSAQQAGATVIHAVFHHFAPYGVSGVVVIQESHLAIHTWPEYGFASVDIFTCGAQVDPWVALDSLKLLLKAGHISAMEMRRGQLHLLPEPLQHESAPTAQHEPQEQRRISKDLWFTERAGEIALSVKHEGNLLEQRQSAKQRIEVLQTRALGRMLVLDGTIGTTTLDEFVAHEMAAHIPLLTHPNPKKVLVLGGGDGGLVRELLKHPTIESIAVVEHDHEVIACCQRWLPDMGRWLSHPKVTIFAQEAQAFLQEQAQGIFDLVVMDTYTPTAMQSEADCLPLIHRVLNDKGLAWLQLGSPWLEQEKLGQEMHRLRGLFASAHACHAYIPSYPTGAWLFVYCAKGTFHEISHPTKTIHQTRQAELVENHQLQYYSPAMHQSAFVLPPFIERILGMSVLTAFGKK